MPLIDQTNPAAARATLGGVTQVIGGVQALRALTGPDLSGTALLPYLTTPFDQDGAFYMWNAASTTADNGVTIIAPYQGPNGTSTGPGRWELIDVASGGSPINSPTPDWVNIKNYGLNVGGGGDDTAAIDAAAAYAFANDLPLYLPTGDFHYNGSGLSNTSIIIYGDGINKSLIFLGAGCTFIVSSIFWVNLYISGISFDGGAGIIAHTFTGQNVSLGMFVVTDCTFFNFTATAIYTLAYDMPQWYVDRCWFYAANDQTSICFAHNGLMDGSVISRSYFVNQGVALKLNSGNGLLITGCDLLRSTAYAGHSRFMIWILPKQVYGSDAGSALRCQSLFGSENLDTNDYFVAYADPDLSSGAGFATQLPLVGRTVSDGVMDNSTTLTSATAAFTAADVDRNIQIMGGLSGGGALLTTIATFVSATQVTLAAPGTAGSVTDLPLYIGLSTGFIIQQSFMECSVAGIFTTPSFIYTTTPNIRGCHFGHMTIFQNPPAPFFEYFAPPIVQDSGAMVNNFGPFYSDLLGTYNETNMLMCNYPLPGITDDPLGLLQVGRNAIQGSNAGLTAYTQVLFASIANANAHGAATVTPITDALGGTDAAEIVIPNPGDTDNVSMAISTLIPGPNLYVEMDIKVGSSSPLDLLDLYIAGVPFFVGNGLYSERQISATADGLWVRHVWTAPVNVGSNVVVIQFQRQSTSTGTTIQVGRVRCYQADGPQVFETPSLLVKAVSTLGGAVAPAAGAFPGNINWGVTDGSAQTPGQVGEVQEALAGSTNFTTPATPQTFVTLPLTAGAWRISGAAVFSTTGGAVLTSGYNFAISTTPASFAGTTGGKNNLAIDIAGGAINTASLSFPGYQIESNVPFTIYLVGAVNWSAGGPPSVGGAQLFAERIR